MILIFNVIFQHLYSTYSTAFSSIFVLNKILVSLFNKKVHFFQSSLSTFFGIKKPVGNMTTYLKTTKNLTDHCFFLRNSLSFFYSLHYFALLTYFYLFAYLFLFLYVSFILFLLIVFCLLSVVARNVIAAFLVFLSVASALKTKAKAKARQNAKN